MAKDTRAAFLRALAEVEPQIAQAFEASIQAVLSTAQRHAIDAAMLRAVETGNIGRGVQEVIAALQLGYEFFAPLDRTIDGAFEAGAIYQLSTLPEKPFGNTGPRLVVRFNGRNPRAENWTRTRAATLISEITEDIETVIRETLVEAVEKQRPYRRVTRSLIGETQGNERKGGLIGLHSRQAEAARRARAELENLDASYLQRKRRDRRFDGMVGRAIREGKPLKAAEVDRIAGRYADRLLQLRGETIARTEGNKAMNAGREEQLHQLVESGRVRRDLITKVWRATLGKHTRDSHRSLHGQEVPFDQPFISPVTGARLDHPHDENAPPEETISCRCTYSTRIDWTGMAR